jgi:hypothetical protein
MFLLLKEWGLFKMVYCKFCYGGEIVKQKSSGLLVCDKCLACAGELEGDFKELDIRVSEGKIGEWHRPSDCVFEDVKVRCKK